MQRSGFGGRHGNKSARTAGKIRVADKSSNFLNLVKAIAGDDLLFCVDALSIDDVAIDGLIATWGDAWGVWDTHFVGKATAEKDPPKPTLGAYNGKRTISFAGDQYMDTATTVAQLNGESELTVAWFQKDDSITNFGYVLELGTSHLDGNNLLIGGDVDNTNYGLYFALRQGGVAYNVGAVDDAFADASLPLAPAVVFTWDGGAGNNTCVKPYVNGDPVPNASIYDGNNDDDVTGGFSTKTLYLASRNNGQSGIFDGSIGCIVAIMRALTAGEVSRLSAAMLDRWNVGNGAPRL